MGDSNTLFTFRKAKQQDHPEKKGGASDLKDTPGITFRDVYIVQRARRANS